METILNDASQFAYVYVGLFLVLGSLGLPFPEEIVLLSAGYLAGTGAVHFWLMLPYTMGILIIADTMTYTVSRKLGREILLKWGRYVFLPTHRLDQIEEYYEKHGSKTVFFSRLVIGFRFVGIMVAGITEMPWKKFFIYDILSIIVYLPIVLGLGFLFHYHLDLILKELRLVKHVIFIVAMGLILLWFIKKLFESRNVLSDSNRKTEDS